MLYFVSLTHKSGAFVIGKKFIADHPSCLILGGIIFRDHGLVDSVQNWADAHVPAS